MKSIYPDVLEELDSRKLVEIVRLGKYKVRGFRLEGANTKQKRHAMIKSLLEAKDLNITLKEYSRSLVEEKIINNIWTYPNTLTKARVDEEIEKATKERVFLELLSNEKEGLLREYILKARTEELEKTDEEKSEDSSASIDNLRVIINELDQDKKKIEKIKELTEEENRNLKTELINLKEVNARLKNKEVEMKEVLINYKVSIEGLEMKIKEFRKMEDYHKEQKEELIRGIKTLRKMQILVFGGETTKEWFQYKNKQGYFQLSFKCIMNEKWTTLPDEIWVIRNLLSSSQFEEIKQEEYFSEMASLNRVRYFMNFLEVEKYMNQLERLYYEK